MVNQEAGVLIIYHVKIPTQIVQVVFVAVSQTTQTWMEYALKVNITYGTTKLMWDIV